MYEPATKGAVRKKWQLRFTFRGKAVSAIEP